MGVFWAFRNKGSSKTRKKTFSRKKIDLGSSQKMRLFFLRVFSFSPSVVLFGFFLSRFWAFRNKGAFKNAIKKNRAKISSVLSLQKKYLLKVTYLRRFFFYGPP
jgi:hypothetical protein